MGNPYDQGIRFYGQGAAAGTTTFKNQSGDQNNVQLVNGSYVTMPDAVGNHSIGRAGAQSAAVRIDFGAATSITIALECRRDDSLNPGVFDFALVQTDCQDDGTTNHAPRTMAEQTFVKADMAGGSTTLHTWLQSTSQFLTGTCRWKVKAASPDASTKVWIGVLPG